MQVPALKSLLLLIPIAIILVTWVIYALFGDSLVPTEPIVSGESKTQNNDIGPVMEASAGSITANRGDKTSKQFISEKSAAITAVSSVAKTRTTKYFDGQIEIVSINEIDGGVEVFARAWDSKNKQIGFGEKGTIDIERFRFFNPPILVPDINGPIIKTYIGPFGATTTYKYREDPREALLLQLSHTISVKNQKFDSKNIRIGTIGNTTDTYYPAAGANSPVDGWVTNSISSDRSKDTWANIRTVTEPNSSTGASAGYLWIVWYDGSTSNNSWWYLSRNFVLFDTSSLGTDSISSATISLYPIGGGWLDPGSNNPALNIVSANTANTNNIAVADFFTTGTTAFSTEITYNTLNASPNQYHNWSFNASGIAAINKSGVSEFGAIESKYDLTGTAPTWTALNQATFFQFYSADQAGTTNDPKLVIEHSVTAGATPTSPTQIIFFNLIEVLWFINKKRKLL